VDRSSAVDLEWEPLVADVAFGVYMSLKRGPGGADRLLRFEAVLLVGVLVLAACGSGSGEEAPTSGPSTTSLPTTAQGKADPTTSTTTTRVKVDVSEGKLTVEPRAGEPGDPLTICGTLAGAAEVRVVLSDLVSGDSWPDEIDEFVTPNESGRWCWTGTIPTELQSNDPTTIGKRHPIAPGAYEIRVESFGNVVAYGSLKITTGAVGSPSQSETDAIRDGVVPELAELPIERRVQVEAQVEAPEGLWLLSRPSEKLGGQWVGRCVPTDPSCIYGRDGIALSEYGEVLLMDPTGQQILRAYPLPGLPPQTLVITDEAVYCGRQGDGGLPDSMLCRIDRKTGEWMVRVFPWYFESAYDPLPSDIYIPDNWVINDPIDRVLFQELTVTANGLEAVGYEDQSRVDPTALELLD
jgi:hypothetical protein